MIRWLASAFEISRVRARSLWRAAVFFFLFVAGVTVLKAATNALFLVRRDPTDLPYLYLATALVVTVVTAYIGHHLGSFGAKRILRFTIFASAALTLLLSVFAALDFRPALGVLYVAGEAYATAVSILFWARLAEVFDVRSAKRIFGAVGAAGMTGSVLGGVLVKTMAGLVPSVVWCFLAIGTMIAMPPFLGKDRGKTAIHVQKMDLSAGDSFGETSILDSGPRPVTARAGDDGVDYLILERGPFLDLISDRPPIVQGLFSVIGLRLRQLIELTGRQ